MFSSYSETAANHSVTSFPVAASDSVTEGTWTYPNGSELPPVVLKWHTNNPDGVGVEHHSVLKLINNIWGFEDVPNDLPMTDNVAICQGGNQSPVWYKWWFETFYLNRKFKVS